MVPAEDREARERRLVRSRRTMTVAAVVLIVLAVIWLGALADPSGDVVLGVVVIEAVIVGPLVLVLRRRRRITKQLEQPVPEPPATNVVTPDPVLEPPTPLTFDPTMEPQLSLRPRVPFVVLALVGPAAFLVLMLKLSYDAAELDPRVALLIPYGIVIGIAAVRARVVVVGGAVWRRAAFGWLGVRLDELTSVEVRRARFLKQEGHLRTILRIADSEGRAFGIKPVLWTAGARPLLAGLGVVARDRGLVLDPRTAKAVERATAVYGADVSWAYARTAIHRPGDDAAQRAPMRSTFWTRRDELGRPTKLQLRRLLVLPLGLVASLPLVLVVGNVGTHGLRSLRCANDRTMWARPGAFGTAVLPPSVIADRLGSSGLRIGGVQRFALRPSDLANRFNSAALQRDTPTLAEGSLVQWTDANGVAAEVYAERFRTAEDAVTFHRDYAEDHCHKGDRAFATPGIPGGVGFRCRCRGTAVDDRVSFVRGALRVQVIDWRLNERDGHDNAITLAQAVLFQTSLDR